MMKEPITRLNILINEDVKKIIAHGILEGVSAAETVRRAISVYDYLLKEQLKGNSILITDDADETYEIVLT